MSVDGYRIYVRIFEPKESGATLLCVHGGPGNTHDYLLPLADLTRYGYRVVFYDALGCGLSDLPPTNRLFTMRHDLKVLDAVRQAVAPRRIHLMGSSYGGLLALAYATRHSGRLISLNSTGGTSDIAFAQSEMNRLLRKLPERARRTLRRFQVRGEYRHPEYLAVAGLFARRHGCRLKRWPRPVVHSSLMTSRPVYETMNGPNEFTITGRIRDVDITAELHRISVPTLLVHGRYDEVTPAVGRQIQAEVPDSRLHIFQRSAHLSFWEERAAYIRLVARFMKSADARAEAGRRARLGSHLGSGGARAA